MKDNPSDKVYTPDFIVDEVLAIFGENILDDEVKLEPHRGGGAFYNKFSGLKDWCEIDDGKDFFNYTDKVDWIITNPPYSIFKECLDHSLSLANEILYVIPMNKLLSSMPRLISIKKAGFGIRHIHYLGSGRQLKFPFGFPVGAVWISKDYNRDTTKITYADRCFNAKEKRKRGNK